MCSPGSYSPAAFSPACASCPAVRSSLLPETKVKQMKYRTAMQDTFCTMCSLGSYPPAASSPALRRLSRSALPFVAIACGCLDHMSFADNPDSTRKIFWSLNGPWPALKACSMPQKQL